MYLFKYYRPDFFFDKAIRYNELYFSAPAQLNDPNDLHIDYRFDNSFSLWSSLLRKSCHHSHNDLSNILDLDNENLLRVLNKTFRGKRIKSDLKLLEAIFAEHTDEIRMALHDSLLPIESINPNIYGDTPDPKQLLISICEFSIISRLYTKMIPAVFSVSFSSKALDSMMWAHYAAGFSGCVIIYEAQQISLGNSSCLGIKLKKNLFSSHSIAFPVKPIKYSNQTKEISILDPKTNNTDLFCIKNRFWNYESEYRIFVTEKNVGIGGERYVQDKVSRNTGHIYHHNTNIIRGVIFGPRMNEQKKDEIRMTIKSNVNTEDIKPCYFFDTELSPSGKIKISSGKQIIYTPDIKLNIINIKKDRLSNITDGIGITKSCNS
ncbi:DUF2971 domain-containing protein [Pectobacterium brasiliense]|uniref:DUF2971 domain-containing protein n=1 Tax=Pectobacterium brasiliense TaxID=180957 RepID=UPI0006899CB4|nr:DUF2971 domain-containing protein [Pectobacterium brasiliense]